MADHPGEDEEHVSKHKRSVAGLQSAQLTPSASPNMDWSFMDSPPGFGEMDGGDFSPVGFGGVSPGQTHLAEDFFRSPSSVTSAKRRRVAASDEACDHEHYSPSKRGCMTAAGPHLLRQPRLCRSV